MTACSHPELSTKNEVAHIKGVRHWLHSGGDAVPCAVVFYDGAVEAVPRRTVRGFGEYQCAAGRVAVCRKPHRRV
jgi:hypothetical protein